MPEPKPYSSAPRSTDPSSGAGAAPAPAPGASSGVVIERELSDLPWRDVMDSASRWTCKVHEHGFISLVDAMPRLVPDGQTADAAIVQAARVSYGAGTKKIHEDRGLIRYLMRHRHSTPFEMVELKFHVAMPVFVARQWIRHRTANVNEYSARYSILPDRFYRPSREGVRVQSASNRQGGEVPLDLGDPEQAATADAYLAYLNRAESLYNDYEALMAKGVSRELARAALPVSVYTEWYWKCDLHNTLRFLSLRLDPHAQKEIRDFAEAMLALIEPICPLTIEAWRDYEQDSIRLTGPEVRALRAISSGEAGELDIENSRERAEWASKRQRLGL